MPRQPTARQKVIDASRQIVMERGAGALTYDEIARRVADGATFKATPLTDEFGYEDFQARYGDAAQKLFVLEADGGLRIVTTESTQSAKAGETLISLAYEPDVEAA